VKRFLPLMIILMLLLLVLVAIGFYHYGAGVVKAASGERIVSLQKQLADARSRLDLLSQQNDRIKQDLAEERALSESKTQRIAELQRQLAEMTTSTADAAEVSGATFDEKVAALLARLSGDDGWYYRDKLIEIGPEVIPFILARLEEVDLTESETVMLYQILARLGSPELVPWFIAGLASGNERVRRECHRALMRLTYQALPAEYDEWALWYASNAGLDSEYWYQSALNDALAQLASDNSRDRADGLMFLLRQLMVGDSSLSDDPRLLPALAQLAQDESPVIRRRALMLLARALPDDQLLENIIPLLDSADGAVDRAAVAMAMGRHGLTHAISSLEPLLSDSDTIVRRAAFLSVARIGGEEATQKLAAALQQAKEAGEDTRAYEFILNAMEEGRLQQYPFGFDGRAPRSGSFPGPPR